MPKVHLKIVCYFYESYELTGQATQCNNNLLSFVNLMTYDEPFQPELCQSKIQPIRD
jgi:hypothetical protein